jgi:hypothetical protein
VRRFRRVNNSAIEPVESISSLTIIREDPEALRRVDIDSDLDRS